MSHPLNFRVVTDKKNFLNQKKAFTAINASWIWWIVWMKLVAKSSEDQTEDADVSIKRQEKCITAIKTNLNVDLFVTYTVFFLVTMWQTHVTWVTCQKKTFLKPDSEDHFCFIPPKWYLLRLIKFKKYSSYSDFRAFHTKPKHLQDEKDTKFRCIYNLMIFFTRKVHSKIHLSRIMWLGSCDWWCEC